MARNWDEFKKEYIKTEKQNIEFALKQIEDRFNSPIERVMYIVLRDEFMWAYMAGRACLEMQVPIGKYKADFVLTYQTNLDETIQFVIECDGHDYHERTKEKARHDRQRDRFMTKHGYIVLRYTGSEIYRDYHNITDPIYSIMVKKDGVV